MQQIEIFVILGHFLPFQPPDNPENQNFKIETNTWRHYHFTHLHQWQYFDVGFLRHGVQQTEIFVTLDRFCPFTTLWTQKSKILKKWKKYLKTLSFYKHKWQWYDAWLLRYGVQWTEFFVILDYFLPFYPINNPKNQNFGKMKKHLEILSFYTSAP